MILKLNVVISSTLFSLEIVLTILVSLSFYIYSLRSVDLYLLLSLGPENF